MKPSENLKNSLSSRELLRTLSQELSERYGVEASSIEKMLKNKTKLSLKEFRSEILSEGKSGLSEHQTEELYHSIEGYKKLVIEHSRLSIETLKANLLNEFPSSSQTGKKWLEKTFPTMMHRAQNSETFSDEFTGLILGILDSGITLGYICYKIGFGIIKSPYDLYLITSGKGRYENWKRI